MPLKRTIALLTIALFMLCCNSNTTPAVKTDAEYNESGLSCQVSSPAGDIYDAFSRLEIPPFFNVGYFQLSDQKRVKALILGKRVKKGTRLGVDPVALFSFNKDLDIYKYVVCIEHNNGSDNLVKEYDEFLTRNIELKMAIENWFRSQCQLSNCNSFDWANAYKGLLELE